MTRCSTRPCPRAICSRWGRLTQGTKEQETEVLLDFRGDQSLLQSYWTLGDHADQADLLGGGNENASPVWGPIRRRPSSWSPRVKVFKVGAE